MHKYWLSQEWAEIKADLISMYGEQCQWCGKETRFLAVHHLNYDNLGHEEPDDLVLICNKCHATEHGIIKPVKSKGKSIAKKLPSYRKKLMSKFGVKIKGCRGWIGLAKKTAELHGERWGSGSRNRAKSYVKSKLF